MAGAHEAKSIARLKNGGADTNQTAATQNFLHGAAIMTLTTIVVKIAAFFYKLPLGSMSLLGDEGYAHFTVSYNIYGFFLTLATAGFPVALSRMISAANTLERPRQIQRTFRVGLATLAVIGGVFSLIMLLFCGPLSRMMSDPEARWSIMALAPAVFLVCITSVYRGYCQGRSNMIPTAIGQVLEECGKLAVGLLLAWILVRSGKGLPIASAGAIFGVTAGAAIALAYMVLYKRRYYSGGDVSGESDSSRDILREFLRIGIPIALGASVLSLVNLLDSALCLNRLQTAAGLGYTNAKILYGAYGKAQTFYNLPSYFITPLTLTVVPAMVTELTLGKKAEASEVGESALRIASLLAMPMAIGLFALAEPIFTVIYWGSNPAGPALLRGLSAAAFFVCMVMMENAVLQAIGKERLPILGILIGGVIKIGVNWFLVGSPAINIQGAPVGSICCFAAIAATDYYFIRRYIYRAPRLKKVLGLPLLCSAPMGLSAFGVYKLLYLVLCSGSVSRSRMALCMLPAIAVAVVVYAVLLIRTGAITAADMSLIPKGDKLAKILHLS